MLYEITEKIFALEQQGKKIIKLNIGEPDWRPPTNVMRTVYGALKEGKDKYASAAGQLALREKIAELHGCNTSNVVLSPGSKFAIYNLLSIGMKTGGNAIIFSPYWTAFELICKHIGAEPRIVNLKMENNFAMDFDKLQSAIDSKTKFIILNSPCNPTSHAWSEKEEQDIIELAREKGVTVLADDAYHDLCFDGRKERKFEDSIFITNTFSKTFGMTGWRIGYSVVPEQIAKKLISINQISINNVPVFLQLAALKALEQKEKLAKKARAKCKKRAKLAMKILGNKLQFSKPNAGFYIFPKLPQQLDTINFVNKLLDNGVAVVPGAAFGEYNQHIRISLSVQEEILKSALEKIANSV